VGCILAELFERTPLFPGQEQEEQIQMIIDLLGFPTQEEIDNITVVQNKEFLEKLPRKKPKDFAKLFKNHNPLGVDLLRKMLTFDP